MKQYTLPTATLFLWRVRLFVPVGALTLAACWLWVRLPVGWPIALFLALLWAAALFLALWYLPRRRRNYKITLSEHALLLQQGVFLHTQYLLPAPRMIYAELHSTPLTRAMGLCGLSLRAARGVLHLSPLARAQATELLLCLDRAQEAAEPTDSTEPTEPAADSAISDAQTGAEGDA